MQQYLSCYSLLLTEVRPHVVLPSLPPFLLWRNEALLCSWVVMHTLFFFCGFGSFSSATPASSRSVSAANKRKISNNNAPICVKTCLKGSHGLPRTAAAEHAVSIFAIRCRQSRTCRARCSDERSRHTGDGSSPRPSACILPGYYLITAGQNPVFSVLCS